MRMMIMMAQPSDYTDETDHHHNHQNDSYAAAGAALGDGAFPLIIRVPILNFCLLLRVLLFLNPVAP